MLDCIRVSVLAGLLPNDGGVGGGDEFGGFLGECEVVPVGEFR